MILMNYQLPVKEKTDVSVFSLSRRLVFSLSTSLLRSFNSARRSSPIFTLSSYKSQVVKGEGNISSYAHAHPSTNGSKWSREERFRSSKAMVSIRVAVTLECMILG
ncbi:uncharacterized protein LOC126694629 isoform X2 [Quercus robur]|uniref:uncharacterized protein LOC126694629 isoform X2 n=1 Tax=Quercus robur TaxID=38942 RepID=UPI0021639329|nr:uncharacterized protein LOC126694629 isoform X2 [Quercus robur]